MWQESWFSQQNMRLLRLRRNALIPGSFAAPATPPQPVNSAVLTIHQLRREASCSILGHRCPRIVIFAKATRPVASVVKTRIYPSCKFLAMNGQRNNGESNGRADGGNRGIFPTLMYHGGPALVSSTLPDIINLNKSARNIVVSFPKSGRTWLRIMLDQMSIPAKFTHAGAQHSKPRPIEDIQAFMPRAKDRVLFLYRDPIDTAVSGYHQASKRLKIFDGSLSEFIRHPDHGIEKVFRFNDMWCKALAERPNTMILSYEELHSRTARELMAVAYFFDVRPSPTSIKQVCEDSRFERMQEREYSGFYAGRYKDKLVPGDVSDVDSYKIRRGKVGGYIDELSAEDIAWARDRMERLARTA